MTKASFVAGLIAGIALDGCAGHQFLRTDGPSASDGVVIALVSQSCDRRYDNPMNDMLDLEMVVQVTNSSAIPVAVIPHEFRLMVDGDATLPKGSDPPQRVAPGSVRPVSVHFLKVGDARCNQEMMLSLDHAIELGTQDIRMRPVSFVPSSSDI